MANTHNGGPAFPICSSIVELTISGVSETLTIPREKRDELIEQFTADAMGMSLRDYFAAKAMQEFSKGMHAHDWGSQVLLDKAEKAYLFADAMLEVRNGTKPD